MSGGCDTSLSEQGARRLTLRDLEWADLVLVMESQHRRRILDRFRGRADLAPIHTLDVPDEYAFMDAELVELLRQAVEPVLKVHLPH